MSLAFSKETKTSACSTSTMTSLTRSVGIYSREPSAANMTNCFPCGGAALIANEITEAKVVVSVTATFCLYVFVRDFTVIDLRIETFSMDWLK